MPLFFFDVHNGHIQRDDEGVEYADLATARREAIRASGEILREKTEIDPENAWKMVIRNERDAVLATLVFSSR